MNRSAAGRISPALAAVATAAMLTAACASTGPDASTSPTSTEAVTSTSTTTSTTTTTTSTTVPPPSTVPTIELSGFQFGYAVSGNIADDAIAATIVRQDASIITAENAMKWTTIHPARGEYNFEPADEIVRFAEANGSVVRGHTLIWHNQLADWVVDGAEAGDFDRDQLIEVMRSHITRVMTHYSDLFPGVVVHWDVVNEAFNSDGTRRESVWQQVIGDDYIALAFQFARDADPDALLFYNDYFDDGILGGDSRGASATTTDCSEVPKCVATQELARQLVDDGVPIDGIGFEAHIFDLEATDYARFAAWTGPLGLQWALTEMDVALPAGGNDDPDLLEQQAGIYSSMVSACASSPNCNTAVAWGVTDAQSWIPGNSNGQLDHALLYGPGGEPKPATEAVLDILASAASV